MSIDRSVLKLLALSTAMVLLLSVATAFHVSAQQGAGSSGANITALPLSFLLDSTLDSHEQDIKENIFEYEFQAAKDDPDAQSDLIKKRSQELKNDTIGKKNLLDALMGENASLTDEQRAIIADETNVSMEKIDHMSKKLEEHAAGLTLLDDHTAYTQSVMPLIDNINDTMDLAKKISQDAKDKKNTAAGDNANNNKK